MIRGSACAIALIVAAPARAQDRDGARLVVTPYVEVGQIFAADLNDGEVLTFTSLAAGVDVAANTTRVTGQLSFRYERRIGWNDGAGDSDLHTGLIRAEARVAPGLRLEAGGIATRTRADIRGPTTGLLTGSGDNVAQVYALYAGPRYAGHAGPVAVAASYQAAYTKVRGLPGQGYDDSVGHFAAIGAGLSPASVLPIGLTASAGYEREDAGLARFEAYRARADVLAPVSPTLAVIGGVGYERIETAQREGAAPRRIAYRTDGVYYDVGLAWRPNRRTAVEARVGRRYGSTIYTGTVSYQASPRVGLAINVYDSVTTFGQQLRGGLGNLPTSFVAARDSFTQQYNGCIFGTTGASPGGCLNSVFQSISTASYRARGADAVIAATRGSTTLGAGIGYASRMLYAPEAAPGLVISGLDDDSYYGQLFYRRTLSPVASFDATLSVNYYQSVQLGGGEIWSYGGTASYGHAFGRVTTTASIGVYANDTDVVDALWSAQALVAARYSF